MTRSSFLLGTTALVGGLCLFTTHAVLAAEVKPIGALDVNIGGFVRTYAFVGDLKEKTADQSGSYDFRTDNEVYVYARGMDEATGLEYGANVEFEADTSSSANTDEAFTFIRGNFGEVRFGDDDGIIENNIVGAATMAAFSGGLDGVGGFDYGALVYGITSDDATKLVYYSPSLAGFQLNASFTPHLDSSGQDIGTTDSGEIDDLTEGGITYENTFGDIGLLAAVTGAIGKFNQNTQGVSEDVTHLYGGLVVDLYGFKVGGGYGRTKGARPFAESVDGGGGGSIGDFITDPGSKNQFYNVGASATFGPANVSLNWGQTISSRVEGGTPDSEDPEPYAAILGADVGVAPGLVVGGELAWFENGDGTSNNDGVLGLAGIRLAF